MARSLDPLFRPRSVAVVGASRRRGTIGAEVFHNLVAGGFPGAVYPVNPTSRVVQSVRAFPTVAAIPDEVDLGVIVVPREQVLAAVEDCGRKGVRGLVVISAGFAETGEAGRALQDEIRDRVRLHGMRMVGPNCLGLVNADPNVMLNATFAPGALLSGAVAVASQSGALGLAILDDARELGIGVSQFVSMGNKADISGNDLLDYWEDDPATRVVLLYLESMGNPRRFMQIARRVSRKKPILMVKAGRTEAGARAASSHTGALAGLDVAVDALLGQAGVQRTDTVKELFDLAMLLSSQPVPAGPRVAVLTNAGGPGIMATDALASRGLVLPPLGPETEAGLRAFLPPEASLRNPVDMIASASGQSYERALRLLLADAGIDAVLVLFVPPIVTEASAVAQAIRTAASGATKPVLTCFMGTHGIPPALSSLREGRFPSYTYPEAAAIALARAVRYGQWLRRPEGEVPMLSDISLERARAAIGGDARSIPAGIAGTAAGAGGVARDHDDSADDEGGRWLDPDAVKELLSAYGIPTPRTIVAADEGEAVAAARAIGFPVALKLHSATITHKTDVGGVVLGIADEEGVRAAFRGVSDRLSALGRRGEMDGVVVQAMAPRGVECFIGVTQDPSYGPLIGFGIGGVNVEVWRDVVLRVHPITDVDAREMLGQIRAVKLLEGWRGAPPADRDALVDALLRVSRLVADLPELRELDINPIIARAPGQGVLAVDARVRVA